MRNDLRYLSPLLPYSAREKRKDLCPICHEELVKLHYLGVRHIVKERGSPEYVGSFIDDLIGADGSPNWCEARSGSYE